MFWVIFISVAYIVLLFCIAYIGDSRSYQRVNPYIKQYVYAFSIAVYCSSWTFYGAVGTAVINGWDYITIYLGPILFFLFGYKVIRRIIIICKQNNLTSISDFVANRFQKNRHIAILVTAIAVMGSLPYIALQLKAISDSYLTLYSNYSETSYGVTQDLRNQVSFFMVLVLTVFSILFGTRKLDATEHHRGMVLSISFESIVKLLAILIIGLYALWFLLQQNDIVSISKRVVEQIPRNNMNDFGIKLFLSFGAILLLPRQFQVMVVESENSNQFVTARCVMPLYLILTSVIIAPIAFLGLVILPGSNPDLYILNIPLKMENEALAILVFVGGFSAATGMVIVASVSLSIMVCNDMVMPYLIHKKHLNILSNPNLDEIIIWIRRAVIVFLMLGSYGVYQLLDANARLANIGLISFAAIIQVLPAFVCALFWRKANSKGVYWGLLAGILVWFYTLMLPLIFENIEALLVFEWLHPQKLFGLSIGGELTHGVVWSMLANILCIIFYSYKEPQSLMEKVQANRFYFAGRELPTQYETVRMESAIDAESLRMVCERIIGVTNTSGIFKEYEKKHNIIINNHTLVDGQLVILVQSAIASVVGSTTAQRIIDDVLQGESENLNNTEYLLDNASSVLRFNRQLLQATLENITHGISVIDAQMNLVVWNERYIQLFEYPKDFLYVGKPIKEVLQYNIDRGLLGGDDAQKEMEKRLQLLRRNKPYQFLRYWENGRTIKSIGEPMPGGGFVTTYEDITKSVEAAKALEKANEELEYRVQERTKALQDMAQELQALTQSKTHFLAAASHDLLQPIHAARLFSYSIKSSVNDSQTLHKLQENIDRALQTANALLNTLLDISKLDSGGIEPNFEVFYISEVLSIVRNEIEPLADKKEIQVSWDERDYMVKSDKQLLLSVLQNLIGNALRYTPENGSVAVILEVNAQQCNLKVKVKDTGIGIDASKLEKIFTEFYRIKQQGETQGLGLGLSIVQRIAKLLDLRVSVESQLGQGSVFTINLPLEMQAKNPPKKEKESTLSEQLECELRVLCLDNDESVLMAMQILLEGWGCKVHCVCTFSEAAEAVNEHCFDVILADYHLNEKETGLEFLHQFASAVPGVLISAQQDEQVVREAHKQGFTYMKKPIDAMHLRQWLHSL